jgi:exodeoxyribonuclease VII large subunit
MTVHYRQLGSALIIFGQTYSYREQIKALGGRFDGSQKTWRIPYSETNLTAVVELCRGAGGGLIGASSSVILSETKGLSEPVIESGSVILSEAKDLLKTPLPPDSVTVRQLVDRAAVAITQAFATPVWVVGEVQNLARRPSGLYFDLAEGRAEGHQNGTTTVRACLWPSSLNMIRARRGTTVDADVMQDGMQVRLLCQVSLYRDRGALSLSVEDIDPAFTKGALALAREQLLRELRQKGLDRANKSLKLTDFPFRVGLVSAEGSRAASDFLDQLKSLAFAGDVVFCPAAMQGESTPKLVAAAINTLKDAGVDLIVVTRGGGSAADLRWFDAPEIAYAIALCPVPVVAAIGHHDDVCVAEEVCYLRQKTPTAAADFVAGIFATTRERLERHVGALADRLGRRVDMATKLQAALAERLAAGAEGGFAAHGARLGDASRRLEFSALTALQLRGNRLLELDRDLARVDVRPWLAQGWTRLTGAVGPIKHIADADEGELLSARLLDGTLSLLVTRIQPADTETKA